MRILDPDVIEEEESVLESTLAEMEKRGIRVPAPEPAGMPMAGILALVATLLLAVGIGVFSLLPSHPAPSEVIGRLMSTERPFQARLSEQEHMPLFVTRDPGAGPAAPFVLDEAGRETVDTYQLGTYYLHINEFEQAIAILNDLVLEADEPRVHNNLGVAYLEKRSRTREEEAVNRSRAREHFEQALELDATFAPSAYNLTLLYYRDGLSAQVEAEAEAYLRIDPDSGWADEIRALVSD